MTRLSLSASLLAFAAVTCSVKAADGPLVIDVWPGKPVDDDAGTIGEEKFRDLIVNGKPYQVAGRPTKWITNVTKPTLTVDRPPPPPAPPLTQSSPQKGEGKLTTAMLICPGGGYHNLGWDVEGEEIAAWLNSLGMTGIILKYRCPRRPGDEKGVPPIGPLKDTQRAVSLVRSKAKEWNLDPQKIGMIGFSAGGHLVGATATNSEKRAYEPVDAIDQISCRPDFGIPVYSGYFNFNDAGELSPTVRLPKDAPPLLFVHASDDAISDVEHSVTFYLALKRAGVHVDLHVYASGGHGFGVRPTSAACSAWTQTCTDWLRHHGFLPATATK
jgi:acetyl esterase/lipase